MVIVPVLKQRTSFLGGIRGFEGYTSKGKMGDFEDGNSSPSEQGSQSRTSHVAKSFCGPSHAKCPSEQANVYSPLNEQSVVKILDKSWKLSLKVVCGEELHPDVDNFINSSISGQDNGKVSLLTFFSSSSSFFFFTETLLLQVLK
ncbi:hypothetical protein EJB05_11369, partial [Eragrostis curvula]